MNNNEKIIRKVTTILSEFDGGKDRGFLFIGTTPTEKDDKTSMGGLAVGGEKSAIAFALYKAMQESPEVKALIIGVVEAYKFSQSMGGKLRKLLTPDDDMPEELKSLLSDVFERISKKPAGKKKAQKLEDVLEATDLTSDGINEVITSINKSDRDDTEKLELYNKFLAKNEASLVNADRDKLLDEIGKLMKLKSQ